MDQNKINFSDDEEEIVEEENQEESDYEMDDEMKEAHIECTEKFLSKILEQDEDA